MNYQQVLEQVKQHVVRYFKSKGDAKLMYHNLEHTLAVVSHSGQIARHYNLGDKDFFVVMAAAWFHDSGYFNGDPETHEARGADIATIFLRDNGADEETIQAVRACIIATQVPQSPHNLVEQIVCDADLFHFGTTDFSERNKLMRKEAELRLGKKISKTDWRKGTIRILESHQYQTEYCRNLLGDKKSQNLKELKKKEMEEKEEALKASANAVRLHHPRFRPQFPPRPRK